MDLARRLAHHPTCHCYDHHLIRIGRLNLCIGCTCLTVGLIAGLVTLLMVSRWSPALLDTDPWLLFVASFVLILPTFVQIWFQRKWFKIASRLLLGFSILATSYVGLLLVPPTPLSLPYTVGYIASFIVLAAMTLRLRSRCATVQYGFCDDACCAHRPDSQIEGLLSAWNIPGASVEYYSGQGPVDPPNVEVVEI